MEIAFENVSFHYIDHTFSPQPALQQINIHIPSGSVVMIVGTIGSGKSTLLQLAAALLEPTQGSIRWDDHAVESKKSLVKRLAIGLVFQLPETQLFALNVADEIAFGPRNQGCSETEITRRVEIAMEWVGLPSQMASLSPFLLSGGEKRRVALASVLAMQPRALLLDEPTAGLDMDGKRLLIERLSWLQREQGMTIVIVTHHMEEVVHLADQIIVLAGGKIAMQGSPATLFAQPISLQAAGIALPEITDLILQLNRRFKWDLPLDIFSAEQLAMEFQARWSRRGENC